MTSTNLTAEQMAEKYADNALYATLVPEDETNIGSIHSRYKAGLLALATEVREQTVRQVMDTAEKLARSLGHRTGCTFRGCNCGAGQEQAKALCEYEQFKRALLPVEGRKGVTE